MAVKGLIRRLKNLAASLSLARLAGRLYLLVVLIMLVSLFTCYVA